MSVEARPCQPMKLGDQKQYWEHGDISEQLLIGELGAFLKAHRHAQIIKMSALHMA